MCVNVNVNADIRELWRVWTNCIIHRWGSGEFIKFIEQLTLPIIGLCKKVDSKTWREPAWEKSSKQTII